MNRHPIVPRGQMPVARPALPKAAPAGDRAATFAHCNGFFPACLRMAIEAPEFFQRKRAIANAQNLARNIEQSFASALVATARGYDNAEEQDESVMEAAERLRTAADLMRENIRRTRGIRLEWTESFDRMLTLIAGMRERIGRTEQLIERLGGIQQMLDELGFLTNLSSLNAIVNAEQSGAGGNIFAAVAEETRKASLQIQNRIDEILEGIRAIRKSLGLAGEMFADFDRAIVTFKDTSDRIISRAGGIVTDSRQQEETLGRIRETVAGARHYTRSSKKRYKAIGSRKSETGAFIDNIHTILTRRAGMLGPCRLHKTVSLEGQKRNVEGVQGVVNRNAEIIREERDDLNAQDERIRDASGRLQTISDASREIQRAAAEAGRFMATEVTGGLNEISDHGGRFGENLDTILVLFNQVETIKIEMKKTVLFNDLLPLVANMAALLADRGADLQIRATELDRLIDKLQHTTGDIENFLKEAQNEISAVSDLHRQMLAEIENNKRTAENITGLLGNVEENTARQSGHIESVGAALEVIGSAIGANDASAAQIDSEVRRLTGDIEAYLDILNRRKK